MGRQVRRRRAAYETAVITIIHYTKPSINELEVAYSTDSACNGWGESCNEYIHMFETAFRNLVSMQFAIARSSCTGALHMGFCALGIESEDDVLVAADIRWIATAAPITYRYEKSAVVGLPAPWTTSACVPSHILGWLH